MFQNQFRENVEKTSNEIEFLTPKFAFRIFCETYHKLSKTLLNFYSFEKHDVWGTTEMKSPDEESNQILVKYQFHEKSGTSSEGLNTGKNPDEIEIIFSETSRLQNTGHQWKK